MQTLVVMRHIALDKCEHTRIVYIARNNIYIAKFRFLDDETC